MPTGNFVEDCSELYFNIYCEQKTTTTVTETKTEVLKQAAGTNAVTLLPQWVTPAYCSSTPGALTTVTRTVTTTTTVRRAQDQGLPQQTSVQEVNVDL
jgi:hypothetical protein